MNWFKKILSASILTSLFFLAPETAQAETCIACGLMNTGGYNLYSLGQSMNSLSSCLPSVPIYLSNPTAFLFSAAPTLSWGGGCGSFTQSCTPSYDSVGFNGYGSYSATPVINSQLLQLINYQNLLMNQVTSGPSTLYPQYPTYPSYPSYPSYPTYPTYPVYPSSPVGSNPSIVPAFPTSPYDNSAPFPTTPGVAYGGCDNITVMCPQSGVNTFENTFPVSSNPGTSTVPYVPSVPIYNPDIGYGSLPPNHYQIPRGLKSR
jgi:hypothetical protein